MAHAWKKMSFRARLEAGGEGGAWTALKVPFDVGKEFGTKVRVAVKGTINGWCYRSSIFPMGGGTHVMMINKEMQKGSGAGPGDTVRVRMEPDTAPRVVTVPADFRKALARNARAKAAFGGLSYSRKKEFVNWIASAKKEETRAARIEKAVPMLVAGKRLM